MGKSMTANERCHLQIDLEQAVDRLEHTDAEGLKVIAKDLRKLAEKIEQIAARTDE